MSEKDDAAAEKAYAEAAERKSSEVNVKAVAEAVKAEPQSAPEAKAAPASSAASKKAPVNEPAKAPVTKMVAKPARMKRKSPAPKPVAAKPVSPKKTTSTKPTMKDSPVRKPAATKAPAGTIKKESTIMATTEQMTDMTADMQAKMQGAYEKTAAYASEMGEFTKANVEAIVESGKIMSSGLQDMARGDVETTKTVFETLTEDMKKMAAVKSPTELMTLQGELMRRNFDAMMSFGTKRTETGIKLANDSFAPLQDRMSVASEKLTSIAA